jgi:hypothetical protein
VNAPVLIRADIIAAFTTRAEALARLYAAGEIDLHTAVDKAWQSAEAYGLLLPIGGIGADEVERHIAAIFAAVPSVVVNAAGTDATAENEKPSDQYEGLESTFAALCRAADEKQSCEPTDPRTERARALLADDDVSDVGAYAELNAAHVDGRAADSTVEALMFSFRAGINAIGHAETLRRLSQLDDAQIREVAVRVQKFKAHIAPAWTPQDVEVLITARSKINAENG